eukprot:TRINITY_DN12165_c0_g1_i12.p3 TRINITY_DN12165_c0_g1~~TRINITY_DN12165_c0_g1_i12.p3  ORF type:complete len:149 (+),score=34.37 TRINITY_DN12165_c0_g1_i12:1928-2374(+)
MMVGTVEPRLAVHSRYERSFLAEPEFLSASCWQAFHNVAPLQPMAVGVDHILAQHGVDANHLVVEVDRHLQLHVFYSSSDHVLVVARNKGDTATMIKLDVTAVNASININTTKPLMVAAAGEPQLLLQAIPADRGEESWQLTVKASKA